ncbi:MAG: substrate-binding domain-containing protein [Bacteroidetes bacterium]|nr:substrate-binding domain-containing protein [Bacteroidota bacterium]MCL5739213.1 substrate-binding domain-containing protein [Bacteroidota bacterium]
MSRFFLVLTVGLALVASSCNLKKQSVSPTEGKLDVYCAESVSPAVSKIADEFMILYKKAHITVHPVPTRVAIVKLLNNETTLIVASRYLNRGELDVMKKYKIDVDSLKIALDGVVVIVNPENPLPRINTDQLRGVFTGKITSWNKLDKRYYGKIIPALESPNSGTVEFFKDRILGNEKFSEAYPCTTMAHVYNFVRDNRDAIGLVSSNWLNSGPSLLPSKKPAPKALEVAEVDSSAIKYIDPNSLGSYYYPFQAHIYRRYYPLARTIYMFSRDFNGGLGAGFLTFAASAAGQRIFLDNGLVPATMPVQLVQLNSQPL